MLLLNIRIINTKMNLIYMTSNSLQIVPLFYSLIIIITLTLHTKDAKIVTMIKSFT